jgi:hypothetical protein
LWISNDDRAGTQWDFSKAFAYDDWRTTVSLRIQLINRLNELFTLGIPRPLEQTLESPEHWHFSNRRLLKTAKPAE